MTEIKVFAEEIATIFNKQFDLPFLEVLKQSIIGYRATILKQEFDKNGRFPRGSEQKICLKLKKVKAVECCIDEVIECEVSRTIDRVPSGVRTNNMSTPFLFVGSANAEKAFTYAPSYTIKNILEGNKFTKSDTYYDYVDGYIYIFNSATQRINVRDVFGNPLELLNLTNCEGKPCLEAVYIDDDMKRLIKQFILEEYRSVRQVPETQEIKLNES